MVKTTLALNIDADVARRAQRFSQDLARTVENLTAESVKEQEVCTNFDDPGFRAILAQMDRHHEEHGLLSDHFQSF